MVCHECGLFSRCANMSCPSVTDRSGLIAVWRPSCPAREAEAPAKVLWASTNSQHSLMKLWYEKGRIIIMNCKQLLDWLLVQMIHFKVETLSERFNARKPCRLMELRLRTNVRSNVRSCLIQACTYLAIVLTSM